MWSTFDSANLIKSFAYLDTVKISMNPADFFNQNGFIIAVHTCTGNNYARKFSSYNEAVTCLLYLFNIAMMRFPLEIEEIEKSFPSEKEEIIIRDAFIDRIDMALKYSTVTNNNEPDLLEQAKGY